MEEHRVFRNTNKCIVSLWIIACALCLATGCDLYEDESGDWSNEVVLRVINESTCLIDVLIDGDVEDSLQPGESIEKDEAGRGVHLLEAYPWNDEQFACDSIFTPDLNPGESFDWTVTDAGGCGACDPTPTPQPATPTPTVTPEA